MRQLIALFLISTGLAFAQTTHRVHRTVTDEEVMRVHKSALLIDTHNDITSETVKGFDIGQPSTTTMTDIPRMKKGGMGAQFFAVYVSADYVNGNHAAKRTLDMIDTVKHDIVGRYPDDFMFATTAADIREARRRHKIAALMGIEGGHAIEDDLRLLRVYYNEGVRYMTLTHSNSNNWADSSGDTNKPHNGLTPFGKDVVREMNRLGMIVDISHVADKTFWDALEVSKAPVFASHSSARAIAEVPRNMTDEMIVALAKKGGVIQINFSCGFLNTQSKKATLADVVKHINHVADIVGVDAIGLGSDFDGIDCAPEGHHKVSQEECQMKLLTKTAVVMVLASITAASNANATIILEFFPASDFNSNTATMDGTLGISTYSTDNFSSAALLPGLTITLTGGVAATTWTSLPAIFDQGVCGTLSVASWAGPNAATNSITNQLNSCTSPTGLASLTTFDYAGGTTSFGIGLANFQSVNPASPSFPITNHELFVNGVDEGVLESLAGANWSPGIVLNSYLVIDATGGDTITSVGFENLSAADFLGFSHLAVIASVATSTPEPGSGWLLLGSLGVCSLFLTKRRANS